MAKGAADAAAAHHRRGVGEGGGAVAALYGERPRDAGARIVVFIVDFSFFFFCVSFLLQNSNTTRHKVNKN